MAQPEWMRFQPRHLIIIIPLSLVLVVLGFIFIAFAFPPYETRTEKPLLAATDKASFELMIRENYVVPPQAKGADEPPSSPFPKGVIELSAGTQLTKRGDVHYSKDGREYRGVRARLGSQRSDILIPEQYASNLHWWAAGAL